jgi:hypothetical protein
MSKSSELAPRRKMVRLIDFYRDRENKKNRCAKSTAHKWINEGKLRAYRLGRMTFVDETFDEFVKRQAAEREQAAWVMPRSRGRRPQKRKAGLGGTGALGKRSNKPRQSIPKSRRAQWQRGILAFHEKAGGALSARLFRLNGAPPPPDAGLAIFNWCAQAAALGDVLCLDCDAQFGRDGWPKAFLVVTPHGRSAANSMVSGICAACAAHIDADVYAMALRRMAMIWPSLREISAAHLHSTGGLA